MTLVAASGSTAGAMRFGPVSSAAAGAAAVGNAGSALLVRLSLVGGLGLLLAVGLLLGLLLITAGCGPPN